MNIDLGRSISYPFEDTNWKKKIGILFLIGLVPGLNWIVFSGHSLTVARNILRRNRFPLPDWSEWSDIAVRGLLSIVAGFIYFSPLLLVSCCLWFMNMFGANRSGSSVMLAMQCCGSIFALIYSVFALLLLNAGHIRFATTDQFHSYIEIGARLTDVRAATSIFVSLVASQIVIGLIAVVLSAILLITCVGPVLVAMVTFLANGYILGSAAQSVANHPKYR
jgi:hypothetical protein